MIIPINPMYKCVVLSTLGMNKNSPPLFPPHLVNNLLDIFPNLVGPHIRLCESPYHCYTLKYHIPQLRINKEQV